MSLSRGRKAEQGPKVEINVVPLVDVSLVLLIIFMVTATFMKSAGMHIQLPSSSVTQAAKETKREIVIGIASNGDFYWQGKMVSDRELSSLLKSDAQSNGTDSRIIIQGDERAAHGRVVRAMTLAQEAGFFRLVIAAKRETQ